jgi:hypothetical protein
MEPVTYNPGIASRSDTYADLVEDVRGARAEGVTTAAVTGLVLRGVRVLAPALSPAAVHLLALLCEHVYGDDRWRKGKLTVCPGNARLALMMGRSERDVRRLLNLLEANHWIIRRYSASNRRSGQAGIDLAPVAARLTELREAVTWVSEAVQDARDQAAAERLDGGMDQSAQEDGSVLLKSYTGNPDLKGLVQADGGQADCRPRGSDGALIALMVEASPVLQEQLGPNDVLALMGARPPSVVLTRLANAVGHIVRCRIGLKADAWTEGLTKHGWAAMAAAIVAVERQGVKRRAGYLRTMLRYPQLTDTVSHSLRRLSPPGVRRDVQ